MADIFISYFRADKKRARPLAEALEKKGYSVWWDPKIPPGKTFDQVIEEELDSARCVVVLWSEESVQSDWVKEEASEGKRRNILIPVLIDDVTIPLGFKLIQAANLTGWQADTTHSGFTNLLQAVTEIVGPPPAKELERKAEEEKRRKEDTEPQSIEPEPTPVKPKALESGATKPAPPKRANKRRLLRMGGVIVLLLSLIVGVVFYQLHRREEDTHRKLEPKFNQSRFNQSKFK